MTAVVNFMTKIGIGQVNLVAETATDEHDHDHSRRKRQADEHAHDEEHGASNKVFECVDFCFANQH